jgi:5-methylcytosine-specific restriction endonuclease McrA
VEKSTHDKLRHAQALLSHAVPGGNVAKVFDRALDALITQLEKRKFGAAKRPAPDGPRPRRADDSSRRKSLRPKPRKRYVPAPIRRAVWERDQGRCTFVSANGTRCRTRQFLEFDHVEPFARGGRATVAGMRLRCRAHNQYEAERAFGEGFMSRRREEARFAAVKNREARLAGAKARVMNGCAPPPSASNRSP